MGKKSLNIMGIVFLCIAVVALVLAIVGMVTPMVSGELLGQKMTIKLFDDTWEHAEGAAATGHTLAMLGIIIAMVGAVVVIAYLVLKVFVGKDIKILGIVGGVAALIGGILAIVGAGIVAGYLNTAGGKVDNMQIYDPGVGVILALIGGIVGAVAGIAGTKVVKA